MFFYVLGIITAAYLVIGTIFLSVILIIPQVRHALLFDKSVKNTIQLFTMLAVWPVVMIAIYKEGLPS